MGVRVTIITKHSEGAEGIKLRCVIRNDDQHIVFWFWEPYQPGEMSDKGPQHRAALAMMALAQAVHEEAAKHLAAHPTPEVTHG